jgi:hypothetical protein
MEQNSLKNSLKATIKTRVQEKVLNHAERKHYKSANPLPENYWSTPEGFQVFRRRTDAVTAFWNRNRELKAELRDLQLAYAFVRGRRYWVTERHVGDARFPSVCAISMLAGVEEHIIEAWLGQKPSAEELEAWNAHVEQSKERARVLRSNRARPAA